MTQTHLRTLPDPCEVLQDFAHEVFEATHVYPTNSAEFHVGRSAVRGAGNFSKAFRAHQLTAEQITAVLTEEYWAHVDIVGQTPIGIAMFSVGHNFGKLAGLAESDIDAIWHQARTRYESAKATPPPFSTLDS